MRRKNDKDKGKHVGGRGDETKRTKESEEKKMNETRNKKKRGRKKEKWKEKMDR